MNKLLSCRYNINQIIVTLYCVKVVVTILITTIYP